jgi:cytochrome c-type biogenesis protein CcmH
VNHRTTLGLAVIASLALCLLPSLSFADDSHAPGKEDYSEELQGFVPGANRIDGMIRAPCCWNQTLDIHGSEVSNGLRREIRRRLLAGESEEAIVASLVDRYGERILAVQPGSPLKGVAVLLSVTMALAGVGAFVLLRRWRARGAAQKPKKKGLAAEQAGSGEYNARLDAELRALDD